MSKSKTTARIEWIDPITAVGFLSGQAPNRRPNREAVKRYAREMEAGNWVLNGEPVIVDEAGALIDGQHRMLAVIESGSTIQSLVVRGVPREAFATIDTGTKRTVGQVLSMKGHKHANHLASTMRLLMSYQDLNRWQDTQGVPERRFYTTQEVLDALPLMEGVENAVDLAAKVRFKPLPPSWGGFCAYLFAEAGAPAEAIREFFDRLHSGAGLEPGDAILTLRERLIREHMSEKRPVYFTTVALVVRAWNAYRAGRKLKKIQAGVRFPTVSA